MLRDRLDDIDAKLLGEVCQDAWPESQTLDFKRTLPAKDDRLDFLVDVCAMANADGGDIVYGVADAKGTASAVMPITGEHADAAMRRLGQILEAGIEPRLPRPDFHRVPLTNDAYALVLRVPASYVGPHRVVADNTSRFVIRSGSHNSDMSYDQLKRAFDRTATLAESARRFRAQRLEVVGAGRTWRPLIAGPICVLQVIPIDSMSGRRQLDITAAHEQFTDLGLSAWRQGMSRSTNLDGLIAYPPEASLDGKSALIGYTQLFRSGAIETVWTGRVLIDNTPNIPSTAVSIFYRDGVRMALAALHARGLSGPAIVGAAFLRTAGYQFALDQQRFTMHGRAVADRADLVLPETWLDDVGTPLTNVDDIARPMLDVLWQAFGLTRCLEYDDKRNFTR
jgi:hypothetical protein